MEPNHGCDVRKRKQSNVDGKSVKLKNVFEIKIDGEKSKITFVCIANATDECSVASNWMSSDSKRLSTAKGRNNSEKKKNSVKCVIY